MEQKIRKLIAEAAGVDGLPFSVEIPANPDHGDYSTNVALLLAKQEGKNPRKVAREIAQKIHSKEVEKVEVAGPGFINFFLKDSIFIGVLKSIGSDFGFKKLAWFGPKKRVFVEHTQPNPFKQFHIGHLMNNAIGESVSRIIAANGAVVKTASYHGDVGLHVAKAIWGVREIRKSRGKGFASNILKDFAAGYAFGSTQYEDDESSKNEIIHINKEVYEKSNAEINSLYEEGRKASLDHFNSIYKLLDSDFDFNFFESQTGPVGKKLVEENLGKVFEKGENGAVIFRGENFEPKTHTRVFLNADGLPTYEAKELGLAQQKKKAWNFTHGLTVTANEQDSFFKVTEVAVGQVFPDLRGKVRHLSHGVLKLPEGKMSSRTGNVITAEEMIGKMEELVQEKIKDRNLPEAEKGAITQKVAVAALKYSILKQSVGSDIIYDFNKSISFEGDSGPYLQYSYTRAKSVLEKAKKEGVAASFKKMPGHVGQLEKLMCRFPAIVEKAALHYQPHGVAVYLTELASAFNGYYAKHKIVDQADPLSAYKVALVEKFSIIMKNGLWLLGIETLERM